MTARGEARPSVCMVAAVPVTLTAFMAPHIRSLAQRCRITLVTSGGGASWAADDTAMTALRDLGVTFQAIRIPRGISPAADLMALLALWRLFRQQRFDVVQSITPKAGLLAMTAACAARVPIRVHWFVGQVWATKRGVLRWLLKSLDRLLARCATHLLADSASQRAFLIQQGVVAEDRLTVLGHGSVCGVDTTRFRPDSAARTAIRREHGIPHDTVVALYLGRLNRDKGIPELAEAGAGAARRCPNLHFMIVGPDEEGMREQVRRTMCEAAGRVTFLDYTSRPESFMAAADMFLLPSHREGFGATVIEAAACGIPTIGTSIYGLTDAVADGESGILVPVGHAAALEDAMVRLTGDSELRRKMGACARQRVECCFTEAHLTTAFHRYYEQFLGTGMAAS